MTENRRLEDTNLLTYAVRLLSGETITLLNRALTAAYAASLFWWGGSLVFYSDSRAYRNPVFDGLFTAAHPVLWGLAWWACGCLMLLAATTARGLVFLAAIVCTFGLLLGWCSGVIAQTILSGEAVLTGGAVALYGLGFTGLVSVVLSPRPIQHEVRVLERVRNDGVDVAPLRQVDRRAG